MLVRPPDQLEVTWEYGGGVTWVDVTLTETATAAPGAARALGAVERRSGTSSAPARSASAGTWRSAGCGSTSPSRSRPGAEPDSADPGYPVFVRDSGAAWAEADAAAGTDPGAGTGRGRALHCGVHRLPRRHKPRRADCTPSTSSATRSGAASCELLAEGERASGEVVAVISAEFGIASRRCRCSSRCCATAGSRACAPRAGAALRHRPGAAGRGRRVAEPVPPVLGAAARRAGHRAAPRARLGRVTEPTTPRVRQLRLVVETEDFEAAVASTAMRSASPSSSTSRATTASTS